MYLINKYKVNDLEFTFIEVSYQDFKVTLMDYGATILSIFAPDKDGKKELVVLAYDNLASYINNEMHVNATVGPTSGRIANAMFTLNGETYHLDQNHLKTENLHGGKDGISFKFFDYKVEELEDKTNVIFTYHILEGTSSYPGGQTINVIYTITNGIVEITYHATTTKDTLMNLTNHAYFNLSGNLKSKILDHQLYMNSSRSLILNDKFSPIGVESSIDSHLDYRKMKPVKDNFYEGIYDRPEKGIDNPLLLDNIGLNVKQVELVDPVSKRCLEVYTTYPCVVCYTHNHVNDNHFLFDKKNVPHMGICFEMQYEPNGINVKGLNDGILKANETYNETIIFKFSVKE
jgi:aldose 1-epimerase